MTVNYVTAIFFILCLSSVTIVKSLSLTDTISSPGNKSIVDHAVRKRVAYEQAMGSVAYPIVTNG